MVGVNVISGESNKGAGASGGMVDVSESKTLAENRGDKGVLREGVRVLGGKEYVESGVFAIKDKYAALSKNRIVEVRSQSSRRDSWESRGVMNMVGRVLGGKFSMDDEEEKTSEIGLVKGSGLNKGKALNLGGKDSVDLVNRIGSNKGKDLDNLAEGTGLRGAQARTFNELNEVDVDTYLLPKTRGEHQISEKVGEYYVSDLVWGKVRSHPWWPGQIFSPMDASDMAARHIRKQSYLIAYFGDQSFAWNEGSYIKPFRRSFSQMEKQSNSDEFCYAVDCALDEVARRVEFGLLCPCVTEEVRDKVEHQVVWNAGVWEEKNVVDGGDSISTAASFLPGSLMQFLESAAECPRSETDRLQLTTAKAQLLAFNRWKGQYELPDFEQYFGLEDDAEVTVNGGGEIDFSSGKGNSTALDGISTKRRHISGDIEFPTLKEKSIAALMSSSFQIFAEKPMKRPVLFGKNGEGSNSIASNSNVKIQKNLLQADPAGDESELVEITPAEFLNPDVVLSKVTLSAKAPMQGFNIMKSELDFLREFRNLICLEKESENSEMDSGNDKGKQLAKLKIGSSTFGLEGTDEAVHVNEANIQEEDVVLDLEKPSDESQPTALILNFTNLDSVPPVPNLNEIFSRFGPLDESETKILKQSKLVKVVFKRRPDAETAFRSSGKYSIFGPSLVSYGLRYDPTSANSNGSSKRMKKEDGSSSKAAA